MENKFWIVISMLFTWYSLKIILLLGNNCDCSGIFKQETKFQERCLGRSTRFSYVCINKTFDSKEKEHTYTLCGDIVNRLCHHPKSSIKGNTLQR